MDVQENILSSNTNTNIFEGMTLNEEIELETTIMEFIDDFLSQEDVPPFSKPNWERDCIDAVYQIIIIQLGIDEETEYADMEEEKNELYEWIEALTEIYKDSLKIPERQYIVTPEFPEKESMDNIHEKLQILQTILQPKQKTPEWYEMRNNMITASSAWKIFGSKSQCNSFIYSKSTSTTTSSESELSNFVPSLKWGVMYESISIKIYETVMGVKVDEFGCIPHTKYPFIGASPDGIVVSPFHIDNHRYGRLIEVKNIVNREITGIPKEEYWIQMQLQMEVCGLRECDFIETRFKEYESRQQFYNALFPVTSQSVNVDNVEMTEKHEWNGILIGYQKNSQENPVYKYLLIGVDGIIYKSHVEEWLLNIKSEINREGYILTEERYWYLDEFSCILVLKNDIWCEKAIEKMKETWDVIRQNRENSVMSNNIIILSETEEYKRVEKPVTKKTKYKCLIKLEE